jgi:hypothetical protein
MQSSFGSDLVTISISCSPLSRSVIIVRSIAGMGPNWTRIRLKDLVPENGNAKKQAIGRLGARDDGPGGLKSVRISVHVREVRVSRLEGSLTLPTRSPHWRT